MAISGSGQPMLRRVASSRRRSAPIPSTTSSSVGLPTRNARSSKIQGCTAPTATASGQQPVEPGTPPGASQRTWRAAGSASSAAVREHQEDQAQHERQVHAAVRDLLQQAEASGVVVEQRQRNQQPLPTVGAHRSRGRNRISGRTSAPVPAAAVVGRGSSWQRREIFPARSGGRPCHDGCGPRPLQQAGFPCRTSAPGGTDARALLTAFSW